MLDKIYICPMHPNIAQEKPGLCSECGMNLIPAGEKQKHIHHKHHEVHDKHKGHTPNLFAKKFWVSLVLTIPVVIQAFVFPELQYLSLVLGSVVFFYGGLIFIQGAIRELRAKAPGMMTLIGLAISVAYIYSIYETFFGIGHTLFWELTTLITVMLLGHWMEMRAVQSVQGALKELSKLLPDTAEVIRGDKTEVVPLEQLKVDELVLVRPGSKIPADGVVIDGQSEVNESLITGESKPVSKSADSEVIAGTINGDGALKVRVTKIGEKTFLAGVMRLVAEAQASKSKLQILSDRAAFYLTIIAVLSGFITFFAWVFTPRGVIFAMERLVAVLVIACPHALGLAIPLVATISTTMAARNGVLVRERLALEAARKIDIVLFDKTGTLTKGEYGVDEIFRFVQNDINKILQLAASVDIHSEHFIAKALVNEAKKRGINLLEVKDFKRVPGKGVEGIIQNSKVLVGGEAILDEVKIEVPKLQQQGRTIIYAIVDGKLAGIIALADLIREESREAITELEKLGVKIAMITGDSEGVAKWVANDLGIDEYFARVLPDQKVERVKTLQKRGLEVAMVGDGINDAPALTQADLGIAIGAGTNVAIESAGIILVKNDPRDIVKILKLSHLTYTKMIQNLFWATGYNIIALPLAAGVLAFRGIFLQPALAALFMSLSTVVVAINAILLRRKRLV